MLDEITYYTDEKTGEMMKQVFREDAIIDAAKELKAIEAQLADIEAGDAKEPTKEAAAAIANYRAQIPELKRLAKAG